MRKSWPLYFAVAILLGIGLLIWYNVYNGPTLDWSQNFRHNSSSPYGNELLYKLVKDLDPDKKIRTIGEYESGLDMLTDSKNANNLYIFNGQSFSPDSNASGALYKFLSRGNEAFISANEVSVEFFKQVLKIPEAGGDSAYNALQMSTGLEIVPYLTHPAYSKVKNSSVKYMVHGLSMEMEAGYFGPDFFENYRITSYHDYLRLGYFKSGVSKYLNFICIKVGRGNLYVYTSPLVFANYHLRKPIVFNYTKKVFGHLKPGHVFWQLPMSTSSLLENEQEVTKSPFSVILEVKSFRYAWYTFLGVLFLFCFLNFKRKQSPIRLMEKNVNSSVEFAHTISKLYLSEQNHKNIAEQKFKHFFNFVGTKYGINLKNQNEADFEMLSKKSKVSLEQIKEIMNLKKQMEALPDTSGEELAMTASLINRFYSQTT